MINSSSGEEPRLQTCGSSNKSLSACGAVELDKLSFLDRLLIGNLPDRFSVLATLGRGTYGNVYLAVDQRLKREVAIKILRPEWMTVENARNRFLRESRAAARLNHSAIVRVIEADENSKIAWQVSDAIRGQSLANLLTSGPVEPKLAARLVADLANAVHCAHSHGVVHRDIKPENVLIQQVDTVTNSFPKLDGQLNLAEQSKVIAEPGLRVFLTDFGLAKIQDESIDQSGSTTLLGTPRYMAPEQFDLTGSRSLPSADIFALGAILFECLTGQSAFEGATSLAQRITQGLTHHPSPRKLKPSLSKDLDVICLKAMHPVASKRYASAAELAEDLDNYLRGQPIKARPQTAIEKFFRLVTEHQTLASITTAVIVCLTVISIVSWQSQREMQAQNAVLERVNRELAAAKDRAENLRIQAEAEQERFSELVWSAGIREAYRYWESSQLWETKQALAKLSSHHQAQSRLDWKLLSTDLNHQFQALYKLDNSIEEVRGIPGTTMVALVSSNGHLYLYDLSSKRVVNDITSELPSLNALAVHPTKPFLYFGGVTYPNRHIASVYQYDITNGQVTELVTGFDTTIESIEISDDGQHMLCASRYRNARLYDMDTLTFREYPADRRNLWLAQTSSPKRLILQKEQTVLSIVDPTRDSAPEEISISRGIQFCEGVPGSPLIVVSSGSSEFFYLINVETKRTVAQLRGETINNIRCLYCCDDGDLLFCATESGAVLAWNLKNKATALSSDSSNSSLEYTPTIDPIGFWHLADNPILSLCLTNDSLVCGTQSGELLELNVASINQSSRQPIESSLNNVADDKLLREMEVRLDSDCDRVCIRTASGNVLLEDLLTEPPMGYSNSKNNVPVVPSRPLDPILQMPLLPLTPSKQFDAENKVGGLSSGSLSTFAFLTNHSNLQVVRNDQVIDIPIEVESTDSLQVLGVNADCQSVAVSASREIFIVDLKESYQNVGKASVRKVASMEGSVWTVAWHPSGERILVGGDFPQLREVDLETLEVTVASKTPTNSNLAIYVNDGDAILSAHTEGSIRYTDLRTGTIQSISPHKCVIRSITISRDGTIGLSIDDESNLAVWKLPQLEKIGFLKKGNSHYERSAFVRPTIRLSEDERRLVTVFNNDQQPVIQIRQLD